MARNAFAGGALDRVAWRRTDPAWLAARAVDPAAQALVTVRGELAVDAEGAPLLVAPDAVAPLEGTEAVLLGLADAGALPGLAPSAPLYAIEAAALPGGARRANLRDLVVVVGPAVGAAIAMGAAMGNWHRRHRFCANCGAPTAVRDAGFRRACPVCEADHFPRTDPVVIMLAIDAAGDRILLGRQPTWPPGRYSCLAGFVEPGESLEEAVAREIAEEAGIVVAGVDYRSSQPWPFPTSLMLGFHCRYVSGEPRARDGELEHVGWFSRAQLARQEVQLPPPLAIARTLIDEWLAGA